MRTEPAWPRTRTRRASGGACACVLCLVLCWSAGCTASQPPPRPTFQPGIGDVPRELAGDYESFAINCSKCHPADRALAAPVTDVKHWDIYVAKMMRTAGSAISKQEEPHILRFLYWYTERKKARENVTSVEEQSGHGESGTRGESTP